MINGACGGLNGDGFFNEEYEGGAYEYGEDRCGPPPTYTLESCGLSKTGTETDGAILLDWKGVYQIWLPKKAFVRPHNDKIETWGFQIVKENLIKAQSIAKRNL